MRKTLTFAVLLVLVSCAAIAGPIADAASQKSPRAPSRDFVVKSLSALTSMPTVSAARWQELGRNRPQAVLAAIAAAERKGWQPTSTTVLFEKKGRSVSQRGLRPIAMGQDLQEVSGDGEMLVWNWDDGNPDTAEGTVWVHSFATGNEETFNVQWTGDTYDTSDISYYEGVDAFVSASWVTGAATLGPAPPRPRLVPVQVRDVGQCEAKGQSVGAACLLRAARDYMRDGVRGAAAGAVVGGIGGAWVGGLAGGLAGAVGGIVPGFASGVLGSLIWGVDHNCRGEAMQAYNDCIYWMEDCNLHQRAGCGVPLEVAWTWKR